MAQPFICDSADGTPAFALVTVVESGDVAAYCAPCLLDWCMGMVEESGKFDDILKTKMLAIAEAAEAKASATAKRRRKAGLPEVDQGKATTVDAAATATPEPTE
jgi:hypothetical protein